MDPARAVAENPSLLQHEKLGSMGLMWCGLFFASTSRLLAKFTPENSRDSKTVPTGCDDYLQLMEPHKYTATVRPLS